MNQFFISMKILLRSFKNMHCCRLLQRMEINNLLRKLLCQSALRWASWDSNILYNFRESDVLMHFVTLMYPFIWVYF